MELDNTLSYIIVPSNTTLQKKIITLRFTNRATLRSIPRTPLLLVCPKSHSQHFVLIRFLNQMRIFLKTSISFFQTAFIIILLLNLGFVLGGGNETDQQALLDFKAKISHDPFNILSSWNSSTHFCQWIGVTCGKKHQRVTELHLYSQLLMGPISPSLGNLSFLKSLLLQNNSFVGNVPQEIGRLHRLQVLRLDDNSLTGQIPDNISGCVSLVSIILGYNKLVGSIPDGFSSLTKLRIVILHFNNLTGGIPSFFGNFSSLEALMTTFNNFGGSIPETLGQLKKMFYLSMGANYLSGTLPPSLYNLSSMSVFCFPENQLRGTLPWDIGNKFPFLHELNVGDNQFSGSIPVSLSNATNLERLTIAINGFSGRVPSLEKLDKLWWLSISTNHLGTGEAGDLDFLSSVSNATSLQLLSISSNNFGGVLPISITNFSGLSRMTLDYNQIIGSIPTGLGNLINLQQLDLGVNLFTGEIPEEIGMLQQLKELHFLGNKLSGKIPSSFGNLTQLTDLSMDNNSLSGTIPPSIGKCQNLLLLNLDYNNLTGQIPREVMSIQSLSIYMGLSHNYFSGPLPVEVGTLKNLGTLAISHNFLSGEIPSSLGSSTSLESLYMEDNLFNGTIPLSFGSLKALQILNLSRNHLSGNIPEFLENSDSLVRLDLSYNDLEGTVPKEGILKNASAISLAGNTKLCGGVAYFQLPPCILKENKSKRLSLAIKLVIATSGLLGLVLVLSSLFVLLVKKKRLRTELASSSPLNSHFHVTYQSLHKATEGFDPTYLLGVGSFGSVYKGMINADGKDIIVAVKVLNLFHPAASKSFKAECEVLKNVRHRNLIKLLTACSGIDFRGNDFKALVYKFMENGNLEEWLHLPKGSNEDPNSSPRSLSIHHRFDLAIDIANALEYLHHGSQTPIVHRDLKPSNVLLDEDMVGHVGDFGLARFFQESVDKDCTNHDRSSTIAVRGSIGYAAPEYGMGSKASTYGDVYAYGILLLEMFTGKRPTDEMFREGLNLHTYVKSGLPGQVEEILDPMLLQELHGGEVNNEDRESQSYKRQGEALGCLASVLEIGVACSDELPGARMSMDEVTCQLQVIKEKLLEE